MKPITIIGGGLAGLTLGIGLREAGVPTTLIEAGRYPRHRVCGEFISGAGADIVRELLVGMPRVPFTIATTAAFFTPRSLMTARALPRPAVCVSRHVLDAALRDRFCELGGVLQEGERWRNEAGEGIVLASGRRAHPTENGWRWFGLKVHARNVPLVADLEMHLGNNSYIGLCKLPDGEVNLCGLFRRRVAKESSGGGTIDWLRGRPGSVLFEKLRPAVFDKESFCAVAGLSLRPETIDSTLCRVGDALTMIPPITGNGMSMALESASIARPHIQRFADGDCSWSETTVSIAMALSDRFERRLKWASRWQTALFSPARCLVPVLLRNGSFWNHAFSSTR